MTTARHLQLLSLLQARRDWPGSVLADRLGVSPRTVRRDVDQLRELGYRIAAVKGPDGGYRLAAGAELPPLLFDDDQAVAVTIALQSAALTGAGIGEPALRALATVRQVLPARLRHRLGTLSVLPLRRPGQDADPDVLLALSVAVRAQEVIRFDHLAVDGGTAQRRRVEPHALLANGFRWYLLAWDLDRQDWRTFRADRMQLRPPNGPRFTPRAIPGDDAAAFVAARFKGSDTGWPCIGEVLLHRPACEIRPFLGDGTVQESDDRTCRIRLGGWSWPALAASLGRFDTDFEVLGPPELADACDDLARRFSSARTSR
jgi:predicted DNA-binding transcriptional regulator YafY